MSRLYTLQFLTVASTLALTSVGSTAQTNEL